LEGYFNGKVKKMLEALKVGAPHPNECSDFLEGISLGIHRCNNYVLCEQRTNQHLTFTHMMVSLNHWFFFG